MKQLVDKLNKIYHLDSTVFRHYIHGNIRVKMHNIAIEHKRQNQRKRSMVNLIEDEIKK